MSFRAQSGQCYGQSLGNVSRRMKIRNVRFAIGKINFPATCLHEGKAGERHNMFRMPCNPWKIVGDQGNAPLRPAIASRSDTGEANRTIRDADNCALK